MALDKDYKINELIKSIKSKDDKGVHTYYVNRDDDGLSFGDIKMPDYIDDELKKAVDLIVSELIPENDADRILSVRKELYDRLVNVIEDLRKQLAQVNATIVELEVQKSELELQIESLKVEIDLERTLRAALEDEYKSLNEKYITLLDDFQSALTKGILEAIERSSLFAQNTALQKQVDSLTEQLFGKTAKIQQGAVAALSFTLRAFNQTDARYPKITIRSRNPLVGKDRYIWINGPQVELYNFTKKDITVKYYIDKGTVSGRFLADLSNDEKNKITEIFNGGTIIVPAQTTKIFNIVENTAKIDEIPPTDSIFKTNSLLNRIGLILKPVQTLTSGVLSNLVTRGDRQYFGIIRFESNSGRFDDSVDLPFSLQKQVGAAWENE
jgi:hypothetical protein